MKRDLLTWAFCLFCGLYASAYKTAGDGSTYTFTKLSKTAGSGVTMTDKKHFVMSESVTIAEGDSFCLTDVSYGMEVKMANDVELIVEGVADLNVPFTVSFTWEGERPEIEAGSYNTTLLTLTREKETDVPLGITVTGGAAGTETVVRGIRFEYVGLKNYSANAMRLQYCEFYRHNGTQSGALFMGVDGARFSVDHCTFTECQRAAIGGAANFACPVKVTHCLFERNSQDNRNIPQLNLTAASEIEIEDCILVGDSTKNMVGGIGVSNFMGSTGNHVGIRHCAIAMHRYGLTTMGDMDVAISGCTLTDNRYETNPNNGGSGMSFYDPYGKQTVRVSDCRIEGSLWGITVIGCKEVNLGRVDVDESDTRYNPGNNVFKNNGNGGVLYDLYNNSGNTVYAQGNVWNVRHLTAEEIENVIFHKQDDNSLGEVIYMPAGDASLLGCEDVFIGGVQKFGSSGVQEFGSSGVQEFDLLGRGGRTSYKKGVWIVNGKKVVR